MVGMLWGTNSKRISLNAENERDGWEEVQAKRTQIATFVVVVIGYVKLRKDLLLIESKGL